MRWFRISLICAVAALAFLLSPTGDSQATPGLGGMPVFSVRTSAPGAADITAGIGAGPAFLTCTSADVLAPPGGPVGACPARVPPALLNPTATTNPISTSLNLFGLFTDDLNGLSFRETIGLASDFDFSVSAAPLNVFPPFVPAPGTVGAPVPAPCAPFVPNVTGQAVLLEAQGDIFTTAAVPVGCNVQAPGCPGACDEAALGLIAPDLAYPPAPPLDDMDALAEFMGAAGPCTYGGSVPLPTVCPAFTVAAGSAVLGGIPPAPAACVGGPPADAGSILVPPGTLASPPCLPAGCPGAGPPAGPPPCIAVPGVALGLVFGADDMDALCWFDINGNMVPDLPMSVAGPGGDMYMFSLTPTSASVGGAPFFSAADILGTKGLAFAPTVIRTAASLGLLAADNVDALICHQLDGDADTIPGDLDNCPANANASQADSDGDGVGTACDNCPTNANASQANSDGDQWGDACDACPTTTTVWVTPSGDGDCDGFTAADEGFVGTDPADPCPDTATPNDERGPAFGEPLSPWPPDFNDDKASNVFDLDILKPVLFSSSPGPPYSVRLDLFPDNDVNIFDLDRLKPVLFQSCP